MSPYHGSSLDIEKKCSFGKLSFKGRFDAPIRRLEMNSMRDKDFLLFGVMNYKSNS